MKLRNKDRSFKKIWITKMEKWKRSIQRLIWSHRLFVHSDINLIRYLMILACYYHIIKTATILLWDWVKSTENIVNKISNKTLPRTSLVSSLFGERSPLNPKNQMIYLKWRNRRNFNKKLGLLKTLENEINLPFCNNYRDRGIGWIRNCSLWLIDTRKKTLKRTKEFREYIGKTGSWFKSAMF